MRQDQYETPGGAEVATTFCRLRLFTLLPSTSRKEPKSTETLTGNVVSRSLGTWIRDSDMCLLALWPVMIQNDTMLPGLGTHWPSSGPEK